MLESNRSLYSFPIIQLKGLFDILMELCSVIFTKDYLMTSTFTFDQILSVRRSRAGLNLWSKKQLVSQVPGEIGFTQSIKCIYEALFTSADVTKCCTETQSKTLNSKQCRCRSTVARKNSLERPGHRKKPREEPGSEGCPVLFWLCRVEIITEHGQHVQIFIDDQQGQIIIITVVVEGATGQHLRSKCQLAFHSRSFRVRVKSNVICHIHMVSRC